LLVAGAGAAGWWFQREQLEQAARQVREDARQGYLTREVTAALDKGEDGLKQLHHALHRLLPDEAHPLTASVLLSDLKRWEVQVQAARTLYQQARKLADSTPEALAPEQKARLEQLGRQVQEAETQYRIAWQLDSIRLDALATVNGHFDVAQAGIQYEEVFREQLHLDVRNGPLAELATQARGSALRFVLAATLDHWVGVTTDGQLKGRLLELARRIDSEAWRDQIRDKQSRANLKKLEQLANQAQLKQQTPQILVMLADLLKNKGNKPRAVTLLRSALVHHPADFWLNFRLGFITDDEAEKRGCYRAALSVRPNSVVAHNNLGWSLQKKDVASAVACYLKAVELDPRFMRAHNNLSDALESLEDADGALAAYQQLLERHPIPSGYLNLGLVLYHKGQLGEAIACFHKAIALDSKDAKPHNNLGVSLQDRGQLDEAIACFRKALALSHSTRSMPWPTTTWAMRYGTRASWTQPSPATGKPSLSTQRTRLPTTTWEAFSAMAKETMTRPSPASARSSHWTRSTPRPTTTWAMR
jgi:tetratricopeptide (TPR) repeat protein